MRKLEKFKIKIAASHLLKFLKKDFSYQELSKAFCLSIPIISRYVLGYVLPDFKRARKILKIGEEKFLKKLIQSKIKFEKDGLINLTSVLANVQLQKIVAKITFEKFSKEKIDKILTAETDGIPLAVQIGNEFGVEVWVAKKEKIGDSEDFIEVRRTFSPELAEYLYLPWSAIKKGEKVLIVDDFVATGKTIEALIKIVQEAGGKVVGIFVLVEKGNILNELKNKFLPFTKTYRILKI